MLYLRANGFQRMIYDKIIAEHEEQETERTERLAQAIRYQIGELLGAK